MIPRNLRKSFARTLLAAMACLGAMAGGAVPASAAGTSGSGGILTVSPAHPDPAIAAGKAYFVHSVAPGATWTDEVAVTNTNDAAIDAWVDAVDGVTSVRTGAVYAARAVGSPGAGAWVKPSVSTVTVAAHTHATVMFTVTVPMGASAGDHLAGLAFEAKPGSTSRDSEGITTVLRAVVAVQVIVPGPADFQLHVYGATAQAVPTTGTAGIALDMADTGGLLGKPRLEITLDGPAGYHRAERVELDTMLPGDRITDEIPWPDALPAGRYSLSVVDDGAERHGTAFVAQLDLVAALRPAAPAQVPPVIAPVAVGIPPSLVIGSVVAGTAAMIVMVTLVARVRRHRTR
ncbi:MAG TPA: DUF916 domain-containing protein [Candidatus Angelobacter sp.]|jgi:hypothetical protein|nr:DUF916 domain-containing protein [Candidatus Angelobacter sp.]